MDKSFWHNSFFTLYGHRSAFQQKRRFKKTAQVCFPYKAVNAPIPCCLSSPGFPPLNIYNKKQEKMQMRQIKKTCVLNEIKPKQNRCVHMLSFWHRLWMWVMQIVDFAAQSQTPGRAGVGWHLEVCSFTQAPPRWVNLQPFLLITLQKVVSCHFSLLFGLFTHQKQKK